MFRDLIPQLAGKFHVIAPDYVGFGYSDAPDVSAFEYTFDNLAASIEELLFGVLGLKRFSIYVQDYGAPVGYRIAFRASRCYRGDRGSERERLCGGDRCGLRCDEAVLGEP